MKTLLQGLTNVCLSGGADGADSQWGMCAGLMKHNVIHWSFDGHRSKVPEVELVRLSDEQLAEAIPSVKRAAKALSKHPPSNKWVRDLIYRNYYQVAWTNSVYAVSTIKDNIVQGGTSWATTMYVDRLQDDPTMAVNCYVFCQDVNKWFKWVDSLYVEIESPPTPEGIWTGIGTRNLSTPGKEAIRKLMSFVKP